MRTMNVAADEQNLQKSRGKAQDIQDSLEVSSSKRPRELGRGWIIFVHTLMFQVFSVSLFFSPHPPSDVRPGSEEQSSRPVWVTGYMRTSVKIGRMLEFIGRSLLKKDCNHLDQYNNTALLLLAQIGLLKNLEKGGNKVRPSFKLRLHQRPVLRVQQLAHNLGNLVSDWVKRSLSRSGETVQLFRFVRSGEENECEPVKASQLQCLRLNLELSQQRCGWKSS